MGRQDQVSFFRDQQFALYIDTIFFELGDLFSQNDGVNHYTVADDIDGSVAEDT